jgi:raffinose/stachyose/melibiose transport system permease protein
MSMNAKQKKNLAPKIVQVFFYGLALLAVCSLSLLPLIVLFKISIATPEMTMGETLSNFGAFYWDNYRAAWENSNLGQAVLNSLLITLGALIVVVVVSSMAGYAIARYPTWYNKAFYKIILVSMMIPAVLSTVPLYIIMKGINGMNTYWAMILLLAAQTLPFSIFVYTGFIRGVPHEIEEAAIVDGCTPFTAFWHVTFPMLKPVTASIVIIQGVSIWNNYGQAVYFLTKSNMVTIPLAINRFFDKYSANWPQMAAAAIIGILPTIAVFIAFQRYFVKGLTAGAVKG